MPTNLGDGTPGIARLALAALLLATSANALGEAPTVARLSVLAVEVPTIAYGVVPISDTDLDPERDGTARHWVTADGFHVDREAFAWDGRGRPVLYRVSVPVLHAGGKQVVEVEIQESAEPGKREVEGWKVRDLPPVRLFVRTNDSDEYRAELLPEDPAVGIWRTEGERWSRLEPVDGSGDSILGVHSYVSMRVDGLALFEVRISNGCVRPDGSGAQGNVYFEDLWVEVPPGSILVWDETGGSQWVNRTAPKVDTEGRGGIVSLDDGPYVFDFRRQTVRRFAICAPGDEKRAARVLRGAGFGRSEGPCSFMQGKWGNRDERIPDFDRSPLRAAYSSGPLKGWRAVEALGLQKCEKLVRFLAEGRPGGQTSTRAFGLFKPAGSTDRGEAGGWLIESTPGAGMVTQTWMRYHRLMACLVAERTPTNFDLDTGEALTPRDIAGAHEGVFPYEVHLTGYNWYDKHELPWWKDVEPVGEPENISYLEALQRWAPIDAEHYVRNFLNAYCWALMTGDPLAIDLVRESAARLRQEWGITPTEDEGWWRDLSLGARLKRAEQEPGQGTYSTRDLAWATENVVAAFRLTDPNGPDAVDREELHQWMESAARWITLIQTPSGVCEARHAMRDGDQWYSYYAPDPFKNGISHEWAVAQWLEESLRVNACASLVANLDDKDLVEALRQNIKRTVGTMLDAMRELDRVSPPKWVGVKPGTDEVYHHDYGSEAFQSQSAMWIANVDRDRIYAMHGDGSPEGYVREICRITQTEAPEMLSHAAQAVAEITNAIE